MKFKKEISFVLMVALVITINCVFNVEKVSASTPDGYTLTWSDEFNGTSLDTDKWNYRTDGKHWSQQQAENVSVSEGCLHIALKKESVNGYQYTGGGVISKMQFGYGYYEASLKFPPKKGWHSSFWMIHHDGLSAGPETSGAMQEIDCIENDSINLTNYAANYHKWNPTPHEQFVSSSIGTANLNSDFHTFGVLYTPKEVKYYYDGYLEHTVDISKYSNNVQNIWLTSIASWLGGTDSVEESVLPSEFLCDWVRYYAPPNLLANPGFEANVDQSPTNWVEWSPKGDEDASFSQASVYSKMGVNRLMHSKTSAYFVTTKQTVTGLTSGNYTLRAMVKSSGGQNSVRMRAVNYGGSEMYVDIPTTSDWTQVEISDINVTNGTCTVCFTSDANANNWLYVDEVQFFKQ